MRFKEGFTIIELIVVIAIIAILASIVLVNVVQYINKGKTAAIVLDMGTLQTAIITYLIDNPGKTGADAWDAPGVSGTMSAINQDGGHDIATEGDYNSTAWCILYQTPTAVSGGNNYWCVDSTGYAGPITGSTGETCNSDYIMPSYGTNYTCTHISAQ